MSCLVSFQLASSTTLHSNVGGVNFNVTMLQVMHEMGTRATTMSFIDCLPVDLLIHHNRQVIPDNTQVKAKEKMSTESVGNKPDRKATGMDESSPIKAQEKMSAKSRVTKSDNKGVGMAEASHTTPSKKMSIKSGGTNSVSKDAGMAESSQTKPHLFLDELEMDVTGTIFVMIGRVWDVNAVTGRYLSTDFVVTDSRELKTSESFDEQKKEGLAIDSSRPREGTLENLLIWARNRKNDTATFHCKVMIENFRTKKGWNYPSGGFEKCQKGVTQQNGQFIYEACNKAVDYPVFRYKLEVVIADDTAHTVVMMFNDTATELLSSAESFLGAGEDKDDESNLPAAIRNLIGTHHVLEIKSHTYYEYGTFESFTCWKINLSEMVDDGASSSSQPLSADNLTLAMKRLSRHPSVCTPSKPIEEQKKRRAELEDSDADEVSGSVKDSDKCNVDGALDKKKKGDTLRKSLKLSSCPGVDYTAQAKEIETCLAIVVKTLILCLRIYIMFPSSYMVKGNQIPYAKMNRDLHNIHRPTPSFADLLQNSVRIHSDTTIRQDGKVQSYCGLRLTETTTGCSGTTIVLLQPPGGNRIDIDQIAGPSTSKYASTRLRRRSEGPLHLRLAKKATKKAAFTSAGVPVTYHNNSPPSHHCRNCNATMWYEEREEKSKTVVNPTFSLYCQGVRNRQTAFIDKDKSDDVDQQIVISLIQMLDHYSPIAKAFCMARDWCNIHNSVNFHLWLHSERKSSRQYNAPTVSEVAAVIINDFREGLPTRDVIVNSKDSRPRRVSELHPSYMALQYPLLFPYGEDGFHEEIPYNKNIGIRKTKRGYATMKEYYSYIIQQRPNQGSTLLKGGRLYQQYLVDAYSAVEEQRLKWTRNNQDTLRVDLYHNLYDAVTRVAICQAYDNPDLFIKFTSNLKWPEIAEMLSYFLCQKAPDRPEVGTPVFKIKITGLLDDLTKKQVFGESRAAELPSPTYDLDGYKVVTDYMLHGPCGKDARYAACTTDGKCSKHFPKAFLPETYLDEDGIVYSSPASGERYYLRMLLNVVRGVQGFEELMTVNNIICPTFKEACFAYGLLNDDREWSKPILEASLWALGPQLRDIFVTMLLFCDVSRPLKLWEETWLRSQRMIALAVASSGIASLLLSVGFNCPEKRSQLFGGMTVLLGGDLRQILPVIPKAKRPEIVLACINRSELWKYYKVFTLTRSMRVNEYSTNGALDTSKQEFNRWVLAVGDGNLPAKIKEGEDEPTWIEIPERFLIKEWDTHI
ncbi:DNA helicase PIF1, ATP-dependent [Tanacetum coccineum]